jgi:hypothetical protein
VVAVGTAVVVDIVMIVVLALRKMTRTDLVVVRVRRMTQRQGDTHNPHPLALLRILPEHLILDRRRILL